MTDYKVQSIVFEKVHVSLDEALDWVICHGDRAKHITETETQYRFRQLSPEYLKSIGFTKYSTKRLNDVVSFIIVYKSDPPKKKRLYEEPDLMPTNHFNLNPYQEYNSPNAVKNNTDFIRVYNWISD
jgi:hypothetical protein